MRNSHSASSGRLRGYTTRESHLKQLALQDETAWNQFYTKYRAMIHGIGAARKLSEDECDELMQEVALICCNKLQNFIYDPSKCRFRSFLFKITENCAFNINRKKQKNSCLPLPEDYSAIPELNIKFMHEYEQFLLDRSFLILKHSISSETYLAFDMLIRQNLPVKEVVARTGISAAALYTTKHRCMKKLREIISGIRLELGIPQGTAAVSGTHKDGRAEAQPRQEMEPDQ